MRNALLLVLFCALSTSCAVGVHRTIEEGPITLSTGVEAQAADTSMEAAVAAYLDVTGPGVKGRCDLSIVLNPQVLAELRKAIEGYEKKSPPSP